MRDLPRPSFMSSTPRELGIGAWGDILCCHVDTPIHDALELFLKNRVSALPLIDENGRVVDIYAKFDVISLAAENSYDKLDCTVQEALKHRSEVRIFLDFQIFKIHLKIRAFEFPDSE